MSIERRKDNKNRVLKDGEYQRKNGSYEYKWRDKIGRRHSIYARTLKELREKEDETLRDALEGIQVDAVKLTVNDFYKRWIVIKRGLKRNTFRNYKYMYTQFVEQDLGTAKIVDLKRSDIRSFYNHLADEKNLKASTIDSIHSVIHQVLDLAVEDDYLRYNPSDNALKELKKAHNVNEEKRKALTIQEQELFVNYLKRPGKYNRWYPIFSVLLWTGMRVGEITGLRWCDINFKDNSISVNHTLIYYSEGKEKGCLFAINTPKTKAGNRVIPMIPVVKEAFIKEKKYQKELGIKCEAVVDGYTDFVFVNRFGSVQHQGTLNKALKRIIRDCNYEVFENGLKEGATTLPNFSNHSLRHTFTTRMCEANVNIKAMQEILGHADAETTLNIYTTATNEFKREQMINLQSHFESHGKLTIV